MISDIRTSEDKSLEGAAVDHRAVGYLRRDAPLYDQRFPLFLPGDDQPKDSLVLRILEGSRPSTVVGQTEKIFHFEVTDDRDPYFLYYFITSETSFPQLKRDLSLAVEFAGFPACMIQLFELCSLSIDGPIPIKGASPTIMPNFFENAHSSYSAKLDPTTGLFTISETNRLKTTIHLHIPMQPGDDAAIKMYLSSRLSLALKVSERDGVVMEKLTEESIHLKQTLSQLREEMQEMRSKKELELQTINNNHHAIINDLNEKHMQGLTEVRDKLLMEVQEHKSLLEKVRSELEKKCHDLEQQVSSLHYERTSLSHKLEGMTREMQLIEADRKKYMQSTSELQGKLEEAEKSHHDEATMNIHLKHEIDTLGQKLDQKEKIIANLEQVHRIYEENKSINEEKYSHFSSQIQDLHGTIQHLRDEVKERDGKIKELQEENKHYRSRIREKSEIIRTQHEMIEDLKAKLAFSQNESNDRALKLQTMTDEVVLVKEKIRTSEERINALLNSNEQHELVISELMNELHKHQLGERVLATPAPMDSFVPGVRTGAASSVPHVVSPNPYVTPLPSYPPMATNTATAMTTSGAPSYSYYPATEPLFASGTGASKTVSRPSAVDEVVNRYGNPATTSYTKTVSLTPASTKGLKEQYDEILKAYNNNVASSQESSMSSVSQRYSHQPAQSQPSDAITKPTNALEGSIDISQLAYYTLTSPNANKNVESPPHKKKPVELKQYF